MFAALVSEHEEIAFRTAYLITRNAADAEDAAQTGLVKAWRASPASAWARRPCGPGSSPSSPTRHATGGGRRAAARGSPCARRTSFLGGRGSVPRGEVRPLSNGLLLAAARSGCARRTGSCSVPLPLELGEDETARVLSLRRGTVKSRTSRALERLRSELGETA